MERGTSLPRLSDRAGGAPAAIGPFLLGEPLGHGRMGVVYRAIHREAGQQVALETVGALDPVLLEGARREIRALANLRHSGVVRVLAVGLEELSPWFAMEYLGERTLSTFRDALWGQAVDEAGEQTTVVRPFGKTEPEGGVQTTTAPG